MDKSVLILAYEFPPHNSIAAHRPLSWKQFLGRFGWHAVVVTRHWDEGISDPVAFVQPSTEQNVCIDEEENSTVIRVPFRPNLRDRLMIRYGLNRMQVPRKALTLMHSIFDYLSLAVDNYSGIYRAAEKYLRDHPEVKVIIASGEPFILFRHAWLLSKKFNLPWVADYRDGWSTNHMDTVKDLPRRLLYPRLEKKWTSQAALRTTASPTYAERLRDIISEPDIQVLLNGYNPATVPDPIPAMHDEFSIGYAGTIYHYQPLEEAVEAVADFQQKMGFPVRMYFFGANFYADQCARIEQACKKYGVSFQTTDRLSHQEVMIELVKCQVLLLLTNPKITTLPAKVFDYLALKRPILNLRNDQSIILDILTKAQASRPVNTVQEASDFLILVSKGEIDTNYQAEQFSREARTEELAGLFDQITGIRRT